MLHKYFSQLVALLIPLKVYFKNKEILLLVILVCQVNF